MSASVPVIECRRTANRTQLRFHCPHCDRRHRHGIPGGSKAPLGAGDGHRNAHCTAENSPYRATGYVLKELPPLPPRDPEPVRPASLLGCFSNTSQVVGLSKTGGVLPIVGWRLEARGDERDTTPVFVDYDDEAAFMAFHDRETGRTWNSITSWPSPRDFLHDHRRQAELEAEEDRLAALEAAGASSA
ncbi:MAG: hypothetical protein JSS29_11065 [Proteobacteria bacterium]|nr:hypothetical protein [Pseudomonadota bacterium]